MADTIFETLAYEKDVQKAEEPREGPELALEEEPPLTITMSGHVSLTFHQNAVPLVQEIAIDNRDDVDLSDIEVRVSSEPQVIHPVLLRIDRIPARGKHHIQTPDIRLDAGFLGRLTEGVKADVSFAVEASGSTFATARLALDVLPSAHWGGVSSAPELLAAFVRPNDPAIEMILREAALKLRNAGRDASLDGYRSNRKSRTWEVAEAIWVALAAQNLSYIYPPASFERSGQKVRSPSDIIEHRLATCLDLALFYAACLEQAALNPVVVLAEGHAFIGLWLKDETFPGAIVDDLQVLRKRRDLEDAIFIEATALTSTTPTRFKTAVARGAAQLDDDAPTVLELAIDIRRTRDRQIRPLDLGTNRTERSVPSEIDQSAKLQIEAPQVFADEISLSESIEAVGRLDKWKRRLLDLSLRNKLLNYKDTRKSIRFECSDPARLEDLLAAGQSFKILPRSDVLGDGDQRNAQLFQEREQDDGRQRFLSHALERGEVYTNSLEGELDGRLTELYRLTRTAFEEGGSNILFLLVGFLRWTQKEGSRPNSAPLLLIPVSLQRSSVRAGFRLKLHEDEPRFNPTLLELLRQDFRLEIPELAGDLPTDESGLDVARIWRIVRTRVRDLKGWEVIEDVHLSTASFTKFLMWKDLVDRTELLKRNAIVRHLIDTPTHSYGDPSLFPESRRLDDDHHPAEIFAPLSADSSQLSAVMAAASGLDFVLFGPPGTGKSQTIANMIAQCLASGKTVLFVSQKTAALEVVQRRLRDIGLGEYCLEVHSAKAQKSSVLGHLKSAWHERSMPTEEDWSSATEELRKLRDELNRLVRALHSRRSNGMTAYEAFGRVVANHDRFKDLTFRWPLSVHNEETLTKLRDLCREMKTGLQAVGNAHDHPLTGIEALDWTPAWRNEMAAALEVHANDLPVLRSAAFAFAHSIELELEDLDHRKTGGLLRLGDFLTKQEADIGSRLLFVDREEIRRIIVNLNKSQVRANQLRNRLDGSYSDSIFEQDIAGLLKAWTDAVNANFLRSGSRKKGVRQGMEPFTQGSVPVDPSYDLETLLELRSVEKDIEPLAPPLREIGFWEGLQTDTARLERALDWAEQADEIITELGRATIGVVPLKRHVRHLVLERRQLFTTAGRARLALIDLNKAHLAAQTSREKLGRLAAQEKPRRPMASGPDWIEQTLQIVQRWQQNLNLAQAWCNWNRVKAKAIASQLTPLIEALERGDLGTDEVELAFDVAYARWWSDVVVTEDRVLCSFLVKTHENTIERFRAMDERVAELSKRIVRARLGGDVPPPTAFGTDREWGALSRELAKKARHMPLRRLFSNIPTVLTKLTPCMMMSPLSIAQYLPAETRPFDVVIFDEASQIPVWDAIGAIARASQAIIVGDPHQLPPTSVGERGVDDVEDGTDIDDQESILDECMAANIPQRQLNWHYRSRHESLITFSNHHYYKGELVTFPSPVTQDRAVRFAHVPGGVYERGKGRVNREEARVVVEDVLRRLKQPMFAEGERSLGVVTFNGDQQRLIENLLDQARREDPDLDHFFDAAQTAEPIFVKNLESVQGDERDVILFSVAVGPDQSGRVVAQISSLNKDGGHRRLNVAITRARRELVVFSTLRPEQIDLSRTKARGVRDFKHFLEFAQRGARALAEAFAATGQGTDSPFEDAVKQRLEARGWVVHPQVGVSGFRIDLGVVDPDAPGRYLAGVECDGATYHRSATARDRDRLREMVLVGLGWRIRRVWSTDWWMDAGSASERLNNQLLADLEEERRLRSEREEAERAEAERLEAVRLEAERIAAERLEPEQPHATERHIAEPARAEAARDGLATAQEHAPADPKDPAAISDDLFGRRGVLEHLAVIDRPEPARHYAESQAPSPALEPTYRIAVIEESGHTPEPARFYEPLYQEALRSMTAHVIETEGPIFDTVLVTRIARVHGFGRAGGKIRSALLAAVVDRFPRTREDGRTVFWPAGWPTNQLPVFRGTADGARDHTDIPIQELAALARRFVDQGCGREEVVRRMAEHFRLGRLRSSTRERFEAAVDRLARRRSPDP